jgi:hypothetical protein
VVDEPGAAALGHPAAETEILSELFLFGRFRHGWTRVRILPAHPLLKEFDHAILNR